MMGDYQLTLGDTVLRSIDGVCTFRSIRATPTMWRTRHGSRCSGSQGYLRISYRTVLHGFGSQPVCDV
jgi:hypothetical protein